MNYEYEYFYLLYCVAYTIYSLYISIAVPAISSYQQYIFNIKYTVFMI